MSSRRVSLWPSPWPAEDGGPARGQIPSGLRGLGLGDGERLAVTSRDALASTMFVLRDPGELFLLRHTLGRRGPEDPVESWVERIDPVTLEPLVASVRLPAGPFWPGGLLAHANGSLDLTVGRWCHRLSSDLRVLCSRELPRARPYNSLVVLASGARVSGSSTLRVVGPPDVRSRSFITRAPQASTTSELYGRARGSSREHRTRRSFDRRWHQRPTVR